LFWERYALWSQDPYFDEASRQELLALQDIREIEDRFYTDLEFGTGGLRGILGAGTNRMNKYVVRKVTQGLAELIADEGEEAMRRGVVIAHDSRRFSAEFAREAALVLARNGVLAYLFADLRPTPELSFAVRYLGAKAGIVVTASHNPKEYNGYKVYWEDGGQVPPEQADKILAKIRARETWTGIEPMAEEEARQRGLLVSIGEDVDRVYYDRVKSLALHQELIRATGGTLKVVYSPLHGAGNHGVRRILEDLGFSQVHVVAEQELPDPNFSTVAVPNPENPSAFDLARRLGEQVGADLLLATDPDADRLGVVAKDRQGNLIQLTGNQVGVLLTYYILTEKRKQGILPPDAVVIKTIASSDLADALVPALGARVENVLTGFKFIAEKEKELEELGSGKFQFGFEESYGYLAGDFVRDKDAVIAALLVCEAALYYKQREGITLLDVLQRIHDAAGYYMEEQVSLTFTGKEGKARIAALMDGLRQRDLTAVGGIGVARVDDYDARVGKDSEGASYALTLPRSNVLRFSLAGGGFVLARPSGTEPKIKFYFSVKGQDQAAASQRLLGVKEDFMHVVDTILQDFVTEV